MFNTGMGFLGHYYYTALDKRVVMKAPTAPITVASKVAIDQLVFTPLCCLLFYAFKVTAEGRPSEYISELQQKYVPTLIAGWKLWPAAHVINFAFIPTQHRILYANVVSVAGTYILSRAAAGDYSVSREVPAVTGSEKRRRGGNNEVLFDGVNVKMD